MASNDFVYVKTMEPVTAAILRMKGIDPTNHEHLTANGLEPVFNAIPVYDNQLYYIQGKPELKKAENGYIREYNILPVGINIAREVVKSRITAKRWDVETGGITIDGVEIDTSPEAQAKINSLLGGMVAAGLTEIKFKALNGWVVLTVKEVEKLQGALTTFIESCFNAEYALHERVASIETVDELAKLDIMTGWPSRDLS